VSRGSRFQCQPPATEIIYANPSDEVLRSAHLITLYDPRVPEWSLVLANSVELGTFAQHAWSVIDIPVDSTNPAIVHRWRDWVQQARQSSPEQSPDRRVLN
jgi:hypothetical protein